MATAMTFRISTHIVVGCLAALVLTGSLASERSAAQAAQGTAVTALTGVRIIDGTGRPPIERGTIVISNGRITAAGASVQIPAGATSLDLTGKTVVPADQRARPRPASTKTMAMRDDLIRGCACMPPTASRPPQPRTNTAEEQAEVISCGRTGSNPLESGARVHLRRASAPKTPDESPDRHRLRTRKSIASRRTSRTNDAGYLCRDDRSGAQTRPVRGGAIFSSRKRR